MKFANMTIEEITASLTEQREALNAIFAKQDAGEAVVADADSAEQIAASIREHETEIASREEAATKAASTFASLRAEFAAKDEESGDESDEDDEDDKKDKRPEFSAEDDEDDADEADEADEDDTDDTDEADEADDTEGTHDTVTASAADKTKSHRVTAAAKVARKTKRPAKQTATSKVVITAGADIPNIAAGSELADLTAVARAAQSRVKGFPQFNARAAEAVAEQSNGQPVLSKFGVASFNVDFDSSLSAVNPREDYNTVQEAQRQHRERVAASVDATLAGKPTLSAAGWCAPSETVYNFIADYKVDGLLSLPEVDAPRGGLEVTQGPQLAQTTYADVDDFGFGGTEAQAIAGYTKTCETIECPEFEDHRLDFTGYCWKIPFLTQKAYPELIADALKLSNVLYAHKMNKRFISDLVTGSTAIDATAAGFGGVHFDTLEAFTQVAVKERRWWNLGENALMEVKLPQKALEIFKFDMGRRTGLALNDIATTQKVAAHFANHNLSVEYVSDWQEDGVGASPLTIGWGATIKGLIYPAGTWVKAVEDVVNLSAVYDAASLSQNEYTGVFFEQGVMTVKMGYRSHVIEVPVCTAGRTGAADLTCAP